jgi:hypothetical protein
MRFNCGSCGQRYEADDSFAGENVECSKCGAAISIPKLGQNPEAAGETPPPPVKAAVPPVPETSAEPEPPKIPKLTMPGSFKKKMQEREAGGTPEEVKAPSFTVPALAGEKSQPQETEETPKMKAPKLTMPGSLKEKPQDEDTEESSADPSAGDCPKCGSPLQSATAVICTQCGHNLKAGMNVNTLKKAKTAGKLGFAIGAGVGAALLSGVIWAAIAVWLKLEIGYIACLIGFITGAVVCLVTPERSARIGALAVLLACVGMLCGKMLTAEYLIRDTFKSFASMTEKFTKADKKLGKQFQDMALMGMLTDEMMENGELINPYKNDDLKKLAPKIGEKPSKAYLAAWKKADAQAKQNTAKIKKKFAKLSKADKARLQKHLDRLALVIPLQQEMIDNGEIPKPDDKWKELAPKSFKEKPSKEYLEAMQKYSMQVAENMKKVKKKLYTLSDAEAERLKNNMGSTISNQISYWNKLKMVTSYWDILWFLLAVSTAWGLGSGSSSLFQRD